METKRKCWKCKEYIFLEKEPFVIEKHYYHPDCLIAYLTEKKINRLSIAEAQKIVETLKVESRKIALEIIRKKRLLDWITAHYDIVSIPPYFFIKLDEVYKGIYKGLTRGIPPEDLLDIWERKWNELEKIYIYNKSKGKEMDNLGRLNYDLAIVLSKSTSYYQWKDQLQTNIEIKKELEKEKVIDYSKFIVKQTESIDYIVEEEV